MRAQGGHHEDAEDTVQAFFSMMLKRNDLAKPDKATGRLRNFLMVSVKHFLINEARKEKAQRRSAGEPDVRLDAFHIPPEAVAPALVVNETPETAYMRQWAVSLLEHATVTLADEYRSQGREKLFSALGPFLNGDAARGQAYEEAANALGMKEGAVRVAAFRLRRRHRELIKQEILATLESPDQYEEERRFILEALQSRS